MRGKQIRTVFGVNFMLHVINIVLGVQYSSKVGGVEEVGLWYWLRRGDIYDKMLNSFLCLCTMNVIWMFLVQVKETDILLNL